MGDQERETLSSVAPPAASPVGFTVCVPSQSPPICFALRKARRAASVVYRAFHRKSDW